MYKLIIVDDEDFIREQLSKAIKWTSLGFELIDTFDDGEEAWEYINSHKVDVVLTDIRMTFMSGIELAKNIHQAYPDIVIVLISGYKEFEYARQAIQHNVYNYLLKPTTYKDIHDTFSGIKKFLDEKKNKESMLNDELLTLTRRQFFTDVLVGVLSDRETISSRLKAAKLNIDIERDPCAVINIQFVNFDDYIKNYWQHGKDRLYNALLYFLQAERPSTQYYTISFNTDKAQIFALGKGINPQDLEKEVSVFFDKAKDSIKEILSLTVEYNIGIVSANILGLVNYYIKNGPSHLSLSSKRFITISSYIHAGNVEVACNAITSIFELIDDDIDTARTFALNLYSIINEMLRDTGDKTISLMPAEIKKSESISQLLDISIAAAKKAAEYFASNPASYYSRLIDKAMSYIKLHCTEDISLEDVADFVALSPVYFSRYFKQHTGERFIDYYCRMRIEKAAELLCNPKYKVYEVCKMVGYNSVQHFYKLFKLYTGFTPTEYRNNLSKAGGDNAT